MNLKDKTILVTGSSSGIGKAIAIECAKNGMQVFIHYRNNKSGAQETLKEVNKISTGKIFQADLINPKDIEKLFSEITKIDCLVNNAGQWQGGELNDLKVWNYEFQNIFLSAVQVSNEFLKIENPNELRKIINISSIYGTLEMTDPRSPQYSAAKAALSNYTVNLAKIVAPKVLVNAIAPGYTWSPAWEGSSKESLKSVENANKIKRFVKAEEIASMVVEVLRNDAVTGEIFRIDGGLHLFDLR